VLSGFNPAIVHPHKRFTVYAYLVKKAIANVFGIIWHHLASFGMDIALLVSGLPAFYHTKNKLLTFGKYLDTFTLC
jgi:hypothetical protein